MTILYLTRLILLLVVFSFFAYGQEKAESLADKQVLLNVTVINKDDEPIKDLKAQDFRLYENKKLVEISYFSNDNSPISVGFLIDVSPSMGEYIDLSREAILAFLERSKQQNEHFVGAFAKKVDVLSEFAGLEETVKVVRDSPYFTKSHGGQTALYDAIALGIDNLLKAKNRKRILFIFGDGSDNKSSKTYREIEKQIKEKNIIVYFVGFTDTREDPLGFELEKFNKIAKVSGGNAIHPRNLERKILRFLYRSEERTPYEIFILRFAAFADQLQSQYVIGFEPDLESKDNNWRNLELKLENLKELRKKNVEIYTLYRQGYYPNSEIVTGK